MSAKETKSMKENSLLQPGEIEVHLVAVSDDRFDGGYNTGRFAVKKEILEANPRDYDNQGKVLAAFEDAVREFLATDAGQELVEEYGGEFTWNDAINDVPDEILAQNGIRRLPSPTHPVVIQVDYDQNLAEEE